MKLSSGPIANVRSFHGVLAYPGLKTDYSIDKKDMCSSSPLLLQRIKPIIGSSSSSLSLSASPSEAAFVSQSHPLMMIDPEVDEHDNNLRRFYDYENDEVVRTNAKVPEEVNDAICVAIVSWVVGLCLASRLLNYSFGIPPSPRQFLPHSSPFLLLIHSPT